MGLIRYSRPVAPGTDVSGTAWSVTGTSLGWQAVDDEFRLYYKHGVGETSPINDSEYITSVPPGVSIAPFIFAPFVGDDDGFASLTFYIRARVQTGAGAKGLRIFFYSGGVEYDLTNMAVISVSGAFANYTHVSNTNPETGAAWNVSELYAPEFVLQTSLAGGSSISVSSFYIASSTHVGPTLGKDYREENWRFCDVCGFKHPYSRFQRPTPPHPQAGLVVCATCYDEPDHDTIKSMSNSHPRDEQDTLY